MAVPKRKVSLSKRRMRWRSHKKAMPNTVGCETCGEAKLPGRVCPSCGHYKGRQVVSVADF